MIVGVDVSKARLDASLDGVQSLSVKNDLTGFNELYGAAPVGSVWVMEATGVYYRPFATFLAQRHERVYVVNPLQSRRYADMLLSRNKTDKDDARVLVDYVRRFGDSLEPFELLPESLHLLRMIVAFADGIAQDRVAMLNRLHAIGFMHPRLVPTLLAAEGNLNAERTRVMDLASRIVAEDDMLSGWSARIQELPGFGPLNTLQVIAYSGDFRRFSAPNRYASYTGLTPKRNQSGASEKRSPISRLGSARLRKVYYLVALNAGGRSKSMYRDKYAALLARGMPKKKALVVIARFLAEHVWRKVHNQPIPFLGVANKYTAP